MLVWLQNAAHNRPGERQGGSQRRQTAKQNKVKSERVGLKKVRRCQGTKMLCFCLQEPFGQTRFDTTLIVAQAKPNNIADSK